MKKILPAIGHALLMLFLCSSASAQSWSVVGNPGLSDGYVNTPDIAVDQNGTPYIAYFDAPIGGHITVRKFNGTSWVNVGSPGFSDGQVNNTSIAIDPSGNPHVVYFDAENGGRATVKKFNGSNWITLGSAGFSDGQVNGTSIAINTAGIPYVVYFDAANGGKATVKRFVSNNWQTVGQQAFSDGQVNYTDIAIDRDGIPYIVYFDAANGGGATVKKFAAGSWQNVGAESFSDGIVGFTTIALNAAGTPYVAYYDAANGGKATVKRFSGASWVTVGAEAFSESYASYTDIAINQSGVPYVVYVDAANGGKATVQKFNGSSWQVVGGTGVSAGIVNLTTLAISNTGAAYIAYYDAEYGGRATVLKYINPINHDDSLALVNLYNTTGGSNWTNKTGWLTGPARTWYGITINDEGYVTGINLFSNNLVGTLPSSLGNMSKLSTLNLYRNQLNGSIPASLGNLSQLRALSLGENRLTGSIPASLSNCTILALIDLRVNLLTGSIPPELGSLIYLEGFYAGSNQLTGTIPSSLGGINNLKHLAFGGNQLSGDIPAQLGNLQNLEGLSLESNQLSGSIPVSLGNLSRLTYLYLGVNRLTGSIPAQLGNLTLLTGLDLSGNIGLTGTIPATLGNLTSLKLLWISNASLQGSIPSSLGNCTNLEQLIISNARIEGPIPNSLGNLNKLRQLTLNNNRLIGPIPYEIGNLASLTDLDLSVNQLSGPVPPTITNLNNIRSFGAGINISNNRFTFDGMEALATKFPAASYSPQAPLTISDDLCGLFLWAGGSLNRNTFYWHRIFPVGSLEAVKTGNPTFIPTRSGRYAVQVTNNIATRLTLSTELKEVAIAFPTQSQQLLANREETDAEGWTHYYYDYIDPVTSQPDYKLLLSLKKNGNNIGTLAAGNLQVKVAATAGAGSGQGLLLMSPLITNQSGYYVMHRYWSVLPANQPATPVGVRFYYNDQDLTDVKGSVPSLIDHKSLFFYKTEGGNPDPVSNIAGATKLYSIANGVNPKLDTFVYTPLGCDRHMAEYVVKSFSGGGGGGTMNGQAILPIKLNAFTGRLMNNAAALYWQTAQEQAASHFNVQRSTNGVDFITIGKVMAVGNSTTRRDYVFTDQAIGSLRADKVYYRLQMEDLNGKQELSKIVTLRPEVGSTIQLLANPVNDQAVLLIQAKEKATVKLTVTDVSGRALTIAQRVVDRGMNTLTLPVQTLAAGIYMLSVKYNDQIQTLRFVKQ